MTEITALLQSLGLIGPLIGLFRIAGILWTAPLVSSKAVTSRLRCALAVALAAPLLAIPQLRSVLAPATTSRLLSMVSCELLLGLLIGFVATLTLEGFRFAGGLLDKRSGLSSARSMSPDGSGSFGPLSNLALVVTLLVFLSVNGHHQILRALTASMYAFPPGCAQSLDCDGGMQLIIRSGSMVFASGLRLALPALFILFLLDFVMALLCRAIPSTETMLPRASIRGLSACGLCLLTLYWTLPSVAALVEGLSATMISVCGGA